MKLHTYFNEGYRSFKEHLEEIGAEVVRLFVEPGYKHGYVILLFAGNLYSVPYIARNLLTEDRVVGVVSNAMWGNSLWGLADIPDERTWRNRSIEDSISAVNQEVMYIARCRYRLLHGAITDESTMDRHRKHVEGRESLLPAHREHHNKIIDRHLGKIVELNYRTPQEVAA